MRRRGAVAGAAAGIVLAIGGSAWALAGSGIVGADGEIDACYLQQNGQLRVVAPGAGCRPSELPLQWSQQGPQGETGPAGPEGPAGSSLHATVNGPQLIAGNATELIQPRLPNFEPSGTYHVVFDRSVAGCTPVVAEQGGGDVHNVFFHAGSSFVDGVLRNDVVTVRVLSRTGLEIPSASFSLIVAC